MFHRAKKIPVAEKEAKKKKKAEEEKETIEEKNDADSSGGVRKRKNAKNEEKEKLAEREKKKRKIRLEMHHEQIIVDGELNLIQSPIDYNNRSCKIRNMLHCAMGGMVGT